MTSQVSEAELVRVWQYQQMERSQLVTENGEPIEVIYPGRSNDDKGADFRDAVIATRCGLLSGDVEMHINSSDWRVHHHQRDAAYNRVILHAVMWHDTKGATIRQDGVEVPVLALHKYIKMPISPCVDLDLPLRLPCWRVAEQFPSEVVEFLDRAGLERFEAKASRFQQDLAGTNAGQVLYQGLMVALGYAKNKLPFLELAHRLALVVLESVARRETAEAECLALLQAGLLGMAGLLPSQRYLGREISTDDEWPQRLERTWAAMAHTGTMSVDDWHLFKVRPNNSPVRRLVAMSHLVFRYRGTGLLASWLDRLKDAPASFTSRQLAPGLVVTADGYWASHFDFGSGQRIRSPTLLGRQRAAEIVINVLLPFVWAWGQRTGEVELRSKVLGLYQAYPKVGANSIERHMMAQLGSGRLVDSARRQQGLIHVYQNRCIQGQCDNCGLSQLKTGHYIQV